MKAWIENEVVRDICPGNPDELYHPDIAKLYDTEVPEGTKQGATKINGVWTNPVVPEPVPVPPAPVVPPKVSPVQFKLLFTSKERIAIATARKTDPVLEDVYSILDDPRLTEVDLALQSNIDLIDYMASLKLITPARAVQIKAGVIL